MDTLRNLPTDAPANLASLIDIREGRVVSMSLSKSDTCQIMLTKRCSTTKIMSPHWNMAYHRQPVWELVSTVW